MVRCGWVGGRAGGWVGGWVGRWVGGQLVSSQQFKVYCLIQFVRTGAQWLDRQEHQQDRHLDKYPLPGMPFWLFYETCQCLCMYYFADMDLHSQRDLHSLSRPSPLVCCGSTHRFFLGRNTFQAPCKGKCREPPTVRLPDGVPC